MNKIYEQKTYFAMALDPIHIGTGGYRLGRVDNTIVREPGSNVPKIPGTSIEGCVRTYSYYKEKEKDMGIKEACAVGKKIKIKGCEKQPCGKCSVCITYGYTTDEKSLHGMAQFSDAKILFFPVHSMTGPVWVTCPSILKEFNINETIPEDKMKTSVIEKSKKLNLGWLYLENEESKSLIPDGKLDKIPKEIKDRLVLVSDKLFSQIVNSNLEVRTSVAIDPTTGAAEEGALYTYEAIPRATILWFDVTANNPQNFCVPTEWKSKNPDDVIQEVEKGLKLFEFLGVGGMATRGFGRLNILNLNEGGDNNGK
ncbi:MAG: type III-B CRISPR module RAMP protein Cmr4 [Candidatus Altiarchaeales archaeon HGW-Altiarchaeales-3]|nr:MAG: type III-B CRISPR module RAMP protein Cmr4 [Candidatus Altiarchaeales archaeon HGW-Altiarchaeales-3]